ncbi:6088_t:CDS:2, partial [Cetraspora pellucida]
MEQHAKSKSFSNGDIKTDIKTEISSPHNGNKITTVICSPKLKYIATSSSTKEKRDFMIVVWPVIGDGNTLHPESSATFRQFINDDGAVNHKLRSVSDNRLVVVEYTSHNEPSIRVFAIHVYKDVRDTIMFLRQLQPITAFTTIMALRHSIRQCCTLDVSTLCKMSNVQDCPKSSKSMSK